jgi:hypothetical protein
MFLFGGYTSGNERFEYFYKPAAALGPVHTRKI